MGDIAGAISDRAISYGRRLGDLARRRPAEVGLTFVERSGAERAFTWSDLETTSNRLARLFEQRGLFEGDWLVIGIPNAPQHVLATLGGWKVGACVLPLPAALPTAERDGLLELADARIVVSDWELPRRIAIGAGALAAARELPGEPLPDRIAHPGKAVGSGGSTGRPKIIIDPRPWAAEPGDTFRGLGGSIGLAAGQTVLIPGPLYHNAPYCWTHWSLFEGSHVVLMERFAAELALDLIERHRVSWMQVVPTMMQRMLRVPDIAERDLSSLEAFMHTAAPCPPWVKRGWIDLVGGEKVYEAYGATEATGGCVIRGEAWLEREGSVGRPVGCEVRILDADRREVAAGEVGEIFMRLSSGEAPAYEYRGAPPAESTPDGYVTVGDLGWVDDDGFVYLADRRTDLIVTGGANVYPSEVEAVLSRHPAVRDAAVVGLPDEEWGKRVHAFVQAAHPSAPPSPDELIAFCREHLVAYKVPKGIELIPELPRNDAGKIRRTDLVKDPPRPS